MKRCFVALAAGLLGLVSACDLENAPELEEVAFRCDFLGGTGVVGLDRIDVSGTGTVVGTAPTIFSNKAIVVGTSVYLGGDVITGGTFSQSGSNTIVGKITTGATLLELPDPATEVTAARQNNDNAKIPCVLWNGGYSCRNPVSNGAFTLMNVDQLILPAGTYYFDSMYVDGSAKLGAAGEVTIYLGGSASFNGATHSGSIQIVSANPNATISFNGYSHATVDVYAPLSTVLLTNNQRLTGAVVGKRAAISGSARITTAPIADAFDLSCGDLLPPLPTLPD